MAFGPGTPLIQQALLTLLQGQKPSPLAPAPTAPPQDLAQLAQFVRREREAAPIPLAPVGNLGPLAALQPEPVPPALPGAVDADAIRERIMALAGPEPVAPVAGPDPLILRIARALQGFGAGVQGQGPQFLAQLQEQRERPRREFEAKKERFETRRQELGLLAEREVLSAEDRRMARTMELIDKQADRDFQKAAAASGIKKAEALERLRGAIDLERDAKKAEFERLEQERKDAKDRKLRVDNIAKELFDDLKISRQQARAFAEFEVNQTPLSKADAKVYNRLEKFRRPVGGTGAAQPKVMVEIQNPDGSTSVVPFTAQVGSGINAGMITQGPRGVFMEGQPAQPAPTMPMPTFPEFSGNLMAPPVSAAPQQQPAPKLTNQQRARFNSIKRERPQAPDEQIYVYMRKKGWL